MTHSLLPADASVVIDAGTFIETDTFDYLYPESNLSQIEGCFFDIGQLRH